MPIDFGIMPFQWLFAAASFAGLGLILLFYFVRGFNTHTIVSGFLALAAKTLGFLVLLLAMPASIPAQSMLTQSAWTPSSYLIVLPLFLSAACLEFLAVIRITKQEWPFKVAVFILVLGLGSLAAAVVFISAPAWHELVFIISAALILIYTSIAALSTLSRDLTRNITEAVLGLSLAGMSLIVAAALGSRVLSETLTAPFRQMPLENLIPAFLLFAILQSLALVLLVQSKAQAERQRRRLRDSQTGVLNLEGFQQGSRKIRHMCGRLDQAVSLVMMQLSDHDTLRSKLSKKQSAKLLKDLVAITGFCLRKYDQIARLDNNCFVMLLPFTDIARAQQACERLQKQLAVELFIEEGDTLFPVAVSMGVTDVPRAEEGIEAAIKRADMALQYAGRNEIRLHPARRSETKTAS